MNIPRQFRPQSAVLLFISIFFLWCSSELPSQGPDRLYALANSPQKSLAVDEPSDLPGKSAPLPSRPISYNIQSYAGGSEYSALTLADMNYDGYLDVILGNRDTNVLEYWPYSPNQKSLIFGHTIEGFLDNIHDIKAADFDKDGDMDLAVGMRHAGLYLATNDGPPGATDFWDIEPIDENYSLQVLVADFDKDGHLDIMHGADYRPIHLFYGNGQGDFVPGSEVKDPYTDMRFPRGFNALDFNGDGLLGLIGTDGSFMRAYLNPDSREDDWLSVGPANPTGDYPCCNNNWLLTEVSPSAGDIDGDGIVDQVAMIQDRKAKIYGLVYFQGRKEGSVLSWDKEYIRSFYNVNSASAAGVADFDDDGLLDAYIAIKDSSYWLNLYLGTGDGAFLDQSIELDHGVGGPNRFAVGDVNGDGRSDIVATRFDDEDATVSGFEVFFSTCYTLTLTHSGLGSNPTAYPPASDNCPAGRYQAGQPVFLSAAAEKGWRVTGWQGTQMDARTSSVNRVVMPDHDTAVKISYSSNAGWIEAGYGSASGSGISASKSAAHAPAVAASGDQAFVAWTEGKSDGSSEIYAKRWPGTAWTEMDGSATWSGLRENWWYGQHPTVAVGPDGFPVVAWADEDCSLAYFCYAGVYLKRWNGQAWVALGNSAAENGINVWGSPNSMPTITFGPDGNPIVAWYEERFTDQDDIVPEIYLKRWNGSAWVGMGDSATGGGISNNSGMSMHPVLAADHAGKPFIAWQDKSSGNNEIYFKRWNGSNWIEMAGSATGGGISQNNGGSERPDLAIDPDGRPIVAWADDSSGIGQIYVKQWNGAAWVEIGSGSASGGGISGTSGKIGPPTLALDTQGQPLVAWADNKSGNYEIYLKHWNGSAWVEIGGSATGGGISDTPEDSGGPSLAVSSDGTPIAAWTNGQGGGLLFIQMKLWNGSDWVQVNNEPFPGVNGDDPGSNESAFLTTDAKGLPIVIWVNNTEVFLRRLDDSAWAALDGSASGGGISANAAVSQKPALAAADQQLFAAWEDYSSGNSDIYAKQWDGAAWSALGGSAANGGISDNSGSSINPSGAIDQDQRPVVAWEDNSSGKAQVYVKKWTGESWQELEPGSAADGGLSNSSGSASSPSLAGRAGSPLVMAWEDSGGGKEQIYVKQWNGTTWTGLGGSASGGGISNSTAAATTPSAAVGTDGLPVVAWVDSSLGNMEIYVKRWDGSAWREMNGSAGAGGISSSSGDSLWPSLAIHPDGSPVVAWNEDTGSGHALYIKRWNGRSWQEMDSGSAANRGLSGGLDALDAPSLAFLDDGTAIVTWDKAGPDQVDQVYARQYPAQIWRLYLPTQENLPGIGWQAGIQVQNSGTETAHIGYSGVTPGGDLVDCGEKKTEPGDSANFLTFYTCPNGHTLFNAGIANVDQPALAISNVGNNLVGRAGGQYRAADNLNASREIFFPLVKHNHNGRTTAFSVQNTSTEPANITAVFKVNGKAYSTTTDDVPGLVSILIFPADAGVPGGFGQVGSLSVSGSRPLAGASMEYDQNTDLAVNLQTASAFSPADYDTALYCPLFRNNHAGKHNTSGLQVQNVSAAAQTVEMTYTALDGSPPIVRSETIQPGASATFYAPAIGIPQGSVGSVVVTGQDDIVAVVNEAGSEANGQSLRSTYQCFPAGSATAQVMVPLYKEMYKGNTSGIQVQNVSGDGRTATVQLTYRATNSAATAVFTHQTPVPDGGSITFWGVSNLQQPVGITAVSGDPAKLGGTYGSVAISANVPIVAIAVEGSTYPNGSGQDTKNYEGFNR